MTDGKQKLFRKVLIKMLKIQVKNNDMHTLDYRMIKKINSEKTPDKLSGG